MRYFKILVGEEIAGVVTEYDFICYQGKHNILVACTLDKAQFVLCGDTLYRTSWMKPVSNIGFISYQVADVVAIEEDEYNILYAAIQEGREPEYTPEEPAQEEEEPASQEPDVTLEFVKTKKIESMSKQCENTIVAGFDIVLSDNEEYHFSLDTQDQLNLITLSAMVSAGETAIPYHADGELCKFYSPTDITAIVNGATTHKTYQVSYYNSLKNYINGLEDMTAVSEITYGVEIPEEYQSTVLKALLAQA